MRNTITTMALRHMIGQRPLRELHGEEQSRIKCTTQVERQGLCWFKSFGEMFKILEEVNANKELMSDPSFSVKPL